MNKLLVILVLGLVACETDLDTLIFQQFKRFINKYQKKYESINEFLARYQVFKQNVMETSKEENSLYKTGITKFSDLTKQEFKKIYLNLNYNAMAMQTLIQLMSKFPIMPPLLMIGEIMEELLL